MNNSISPRLNPPMATEAQPPVDWAMEGVAANIKLLLKLVEDHKYAACNKERNHEGKTTLRGATMIAILDNVRSRIHLGCQNSTNNGDPMPNLNIPAVVVDDSKERRLRRELNASLAQQKSLQAMCSSLGKEKDIIAAELSRKVQELSGMEELVNDLKAQNEALLRKVQDYKNNSGCMLDDERKYSISGGGGELQGVEALKERNRALSEQLLRSLDGYRVMKRKLKAAQEQNVAMHATMDDMLVEVDKFKEHISTRDCGVDEAINAGAESMVECLRKMVMKHTHDKSKKQQPLGINA